VDLQLYARVLWRFKLLIVLGLLLATALATLSLVRVSPEGVKYRQAEVWSSTTRLGVTQKGFPWGRLLAQEPTPSETAERLGIPLADQNRLTGLAVLYAELATSDPVRQLMRREGRILGSIVVTPVIAGNTPLPLIDVTAMASSGPLAVRLARRAAEAFETYMQQQQRQSKVPVSDRVVVQQLVRPQPPEIFRGRSKTLPVVVFLAVMFAVVGLAFLLENLRPSRITPDEAAEPEFRARRSA
jgi:hypothetical protein